MLGRDARERAVVEVDLDLGPCVEPERARSDVAAEAVQLSVEKTPRRPV